MSSNFGPLLRLSDARFAVEPRGVVFEFETDGRLRIADRLAVSASYERVDGWRPGLEELHAAERQLDERRTPSDGEPRA